MAIIDAAARGLKLNGSDEADAFNTLLASLNPGDTLVLNGKLGVGASGITLANKTGVRIHSTGNGVIKLLASPTQSGRSLEAVGFLIDNCTNCTVSNIQLWGRNHPASGWLLQDCVNCTLQGNNARQLLGQAAYAVLGGRRNQLVNNQALDCDGDETCGFWLGGYDASDTCPFLHVSGNRADTVDGIGFALTSADAVFLHNKTHGCGSHGLQLSTTPNLSFQGALVISDNNFEHSSGCGVYTQIGLADDPDLENLVLVGNTAWNNTQDGMQIRRSRNLVLMGNESHHNSGWGISIDQVPEGYAYHLGDNSCLANTSGDIYRGAGFTAEAPCKVTMVQPSSGNSLFWYFDQDLVLPTGGGSVVEFEVEQTPNSNNWMAGFHLELSSLQPRRLEIGYLLKPSAGCRWRITQTPEYIQSVVPFAIPQSGVVQSV